MISYKGLEAKLNERGITRSDLTKELGISSRTIAKIGRGEKLSRVVMEKLCGYFSCTAAEQENTARIQMVIIMAARVMKFFLFAVFIVVSSLSLFNAGFGRLVPFDGLSIWGSLSVP